ncbi:STAS domain-containing protein [Vibrio sp. SCSIO 43135]|uniref:STAS domain-containing protein n=1 Tax=Vibrio sp. SCSIO 43135 TaxID=2819096 RepID=UPI0020761BA6|nr:STAS domain-containing protein [Vibrio sp. SCSIO 43135]USD43369.1 STAS domain-containing protein [Vibrio sp. SCSIO 43135]
MDCLLGESLEISTVMDAKVQYEEWLKQPSPLNIDASQVGRVDAAGLQLLASLFVSARNTNLDITLNSASDVLQEGIGLLALQHVFEPHREE